jgi:hypothetical protein
MKKHSQQRDQTRASAAKEKRPNSKPGGEKGASAETKEETAKHASVDPSSPTSSDWNTDTGMSRNMTPHHVWFKMYTPHVVPIRLADDSCIYSEGVGLVVFWPKDKDGKEMDPVEFHDVLHVPALRNNLLSQFHLTREKGFSVSIEGPTVDFIHSGKIRFSAHRAQGQTLSKVIVDLESCRGTEAPYVMLSRATSLSSILILRPFQKKKLTCALLQEAQLERARLSELFLHTLREFGDPDQSEQAGYKLNSLGDTPDPGRMIYNHLCLLFIGGTCTAVVRAQIDISKQL